MIPVFVYPCRWNCFTYFCVIWFLGYTHNVQGLIRGLCSGINPSGISAEFGNQESNTCVSQASYLFCYCTSSCTVFFLYSTSVVFRNVVKVLIYMNLSCCCILGCFYNILCTIYKRLIIISGGIASTVDREHFWNKFDPPHMFPPSLSEMIPVCYKL